MPGTDPGAAVSTRDAAGVHSGSEVLLTPVRVFGALTEPVRANVAREIRRSLGVRGKPPPPPVTDPATSFLDPSGVARRVHADLPVMMIGGLSALFLQMLHPLTMAGVAEHSAYREDPIGRLHRTAQFVGATTYGSVGDAREAVARVQRVHRRVQGAAPDGRPYSAGDPGLLTWVHVAETSSFLAAAQRFGSRHLSAADADRYFDETAAVAVELGARDVPRSSAEVSTYFARIRPELSAGDQAIAARDFLLRGVARRPEERAVYSVVVGAAIGLLPRWARRSLRLPDPPLVDLMVVAPVARALSVGLRWAVPPPRSASN